MKNGVLNQLTAMKKAKELGFDAMEFSSILLHDGSTPVEYAKMLRREADAMDFPIVSLVIPADLINGREGRTPDEEIEFVKSMVDIAEILGVKTMRHDATSALTKYHSFDAALPELAKRINEITEYARTKGIKTCVENHGYICQDPERVERLYNAVNNGNFGLLCDMGNFLCVDADPAKAVSLVAPYTVFVHTKDFYVRSGALDAPGAGYFMNRGANYLKGTIVGHGNVPVKQCLKALKRAGYDGYVSIEFEGMEEPIEALTIGLSNLKRFISEI
jgi:sugar phosphate isomerase/epimerase